MKSLLGAAFLVATLFTVVLVGPAISADVVSVPEDATAVTVGESARAAFHFDVSSLEGVDWENGRSVYLEWTLSGVPSTERSEYWVYAAGASWATSGDVAELELGEAPLESWDIEVKDYERAGGFVRFDVTELVKAWLEDESPNRGLLVVTEALSASALQEQLANARLIVR